MLFFTNFQLYIFHKIVYVDFHYLKKCQITMIRNTKSSEKFSLPLRLFVVWQMFSAATLKNQFRTLLQSSPLQFILDENYLCTILPIQRFIFYLIAIFCKYEFSFVWKRTSQKKGVQKPSIKNQLFYYFALIEKIVRHSYQKIPVVFTIQNSRILLWNYSVSLLTEKLLEIPFVTATC